MSACLMTTASRRSQRRPRTQQKSHQEERASAAMNQSVQRRGTESQEVVFNQRPPTALSALLVNVQSSTVTVGKYGELWWGGISEEVLFR